MYPSTVHLPMQMSPIYLNSVMRQNATTPVIKFCHKRLYIMKKLARCIMIPPYFSFKIFFQSVFHFYLFSFNDHKHNINCCHFPNGAEGMWQCHSFAAPSGFSWFAWMPGHVTLECHWVFPHIKDEIPPCWGEVRAFPANTLRSTLSICLSHSLRGGESVSGKGHTVKA